MSNNTQQPLPKSLRTQLENTVKAARDIAEKGAKAALAQLAVGEAKAPDYLVSDELKSLRRRLRAHGRALGDAKAKDDTHGTQHLMWEVAYEHWHRMLFARFLAENGLLMWEPGASVSLDDCRDMVDNHPDMTMGAKSHWELAGRLAARMLPQVFKPQSPVFELGFAPEHQRELERLLAALPSDVFKASDSLGWVYQSWQARRKDEIDKAIKSGLKVGSDEMGAKTQLFTEPYMVDFLLHNSLGAWWVTRHPEKSCPVQLAYMRTLDDGTPAGGRFEGWPDRLEDFKLLDPCCGSGHFLVAAFLMLVPMRMEAEGLSAMDAVDAVLADNLHGLELDARCVEIAVFALALAAWRFLDENNIPLGVREDMPMPNIACCGLAVAAKPEDWVALVPNDTPTSAYLRQEMKLLHTSFAQAPLLGSLLDPAHSLKQDLATTSFEALRDLLERALASEIAAGTASESNDDTWDIAIAARGLLDAARLLNGRYSMVVTNVPYLTRSTQSDALRDYCEKYYFDAKNDIANVFLERCLELCAPEGAGVVQLVMTQNWLFLGTYRRQREHLLRHSTWNLLAKLGGGGDAFENGPGNITNICMLTLTRQLPASEATFSAIDVGKGRNPKQKAEDLLVRDFARLTQTSQLKNPDARISVLDEDSAGLLALIATGNQGIKTSDDPSFVRNFWELSKISPDWEFFQSTVESTTHYGGLEQIVLFESGKGRMRQLATTQDRDRRRDLQGRNAWGRWGIAISCMGTLPAALYGGWKFDTNIATIVPSNQSHLPAIWCFCSSPEYHEAIRKIDQKLNVTNATLVKVPFDIARWTEIANESYPDGLSKPHSNDPTQWVFHGHPQPATDALQVAVARLLGYRWPSEADAEMELSDAARDWIARSNMLASHVDDDGIVCLPSVRGEPPAHDRLLALLITAWESVSAGSWKPTTLARLLAEADWEDKGLDAWLREKFFEQHAKLFHHRPFVWHIWDGLRDGFGALVNYHKLDTKNLERLIHTYLGDWIRQQESAVRDGVDGAPTRLAAAQDLKRRLELILEGEAPYDIFVRWKSLAQQTIGWSPDPNDGVRLNVRPFLTAAVLRHHKKPKLNIDFAGRDQTDRGKDAESAPWFKTFNGERINDHHLTLADKRAARERA